jgi:hypothetical protein
LIYCSHTLNSIRCDHILPSWTILNVSHVEAWLRFAFNSPFDSATKYFPWYDVNASPFPFSSTVHVSHVLAWGRFAFTVPSASATRYFPWCPLNWTLSSPIKVTTKISHAPRLSRLAFALPLSSATTYLLWWVLSATLQIEPSVQPNSFLVSAKCYWISNQGHHGRF